jgi:enoyl-CoA hydratase/carnithine racemase
MNRVKFKTLEWDRAGPLELIFLNRPPANFFDYEMIGEIGVALRQADDDQATRVVILAARGNVFCAGANFSSPGRDGEAPIVPGLIYRAGAELLRTRKPIIAAVQGAAIGGGLGLACIADFRVTCPEARLSANFCRIGFHPGFALTAFLPRLVGQQAAAKMMYTGERIDGQTAVAMGLADILAPDRTSVLAAATQLATEIAESAPLAVMATRETLRSGMAELYEAATERERVEQDRLRSTSDFAEGVKAYAERRRPEFRGA